MLYAITYLCLAATCSLSEISPNWGRFEYASLDACQAVTSQARPMNIRLGCVDQTHHATFAEDVMDTLSVRP